MEEIKIGHSIRKIRELRNFTEQYMADRLEMTVQGYSKIELDQVGVTINKLGKIAEILGATIEEILAFNEKNVFYNYGSGGANHVAGNYIEAGGADKKHEEEINHLKEEIVFLRKLLEDRGKGNENSYKG